MAGLSLAADLDRLAESRAGIDALIEGHVEKIARGREYLARALAADLEKLGEVRTDIDDLVAAQVGKIAEGRAVLSQALRSDLEEVAAGRGAFDEMVASHVARLAEGHVGAQFWSVYVSADLPEPQAAVATVEQIDVTKRLIARYPDRLVLALTGDDVERAMGDGKIASLIGMEGGHSIAGSLAVLRQMYDLGARYMTLTHSKNLAWADSATATPEHDGLTDFGRDVVREMQRIGMLVDLSHVSDATMNDALDVARAPVIFSHSGARAVAPHVRNVPDDVLSLLPANGGVVMITFVPTFLSAEDWAWSRERAAEDARLKSLYSYSKEKQDAGLKAWEAAHPAPQLTVSIVADHIEHAVKIAGHDHVGIGGDLDGIDRTVVGLGGVEGYPNLFAELIRRGWSDANLARLAGGNILRVMRRAEAVAGAMKDEPASMATLDPSE